MLLEEGEAYNNMAYQWIYYTRELHHLEYNNHIWAVLLFIMFSNAALLNNLSIAGL